MTMARNPLLDEIQKASHLELLRERQRSLAHDVPFSLEIAGNVRGVRVINDSAATNVVKVAESLASMSVPVVWIVEANKWLEDVACLNDLVREKVKTVIATGACADELHSALWPGMTLFISASTWEEALDLATMSATPDDAVLFSPGCRADEPFANFRERGAYFNRLVDIKQKTKITIP